MSLAPLAKKLLTSLLCLFVPMYCYGGPASPYVVTMSGPGGPVSLHIAFMFERSFVLQHCALAVQHRRKF